MQKKAVTQHALLGELMVALQTGRAGEDIWNAGEPDDVSERKSMPLPMLRYLLAVQLKSMAQQDNIISVDPKSGLLSYVV